MNTQTLHEKIDAAHIWNSGLFLVSKLCKNARALYLFWVLPAPLFSAWANSYSTTFLMLLWSDLGFSRSLPQYLPIFARNSRHKYVFIRRIILFKAMFSLVLCGVLIAITVPLATYLRLGEHRIFFYLGALLFLTESLKSILRLIYHSYFWQKRFNTIDGAVVATYTAVSLTGAILLTSKTAIVYTAFGAHIIGSILTTMITAMLLPSLIRDHHYQGEESFDAAATTREFATHSAMMWSLLATGSITERNVLVPFITRLLGIESANHFKIANDVALLAQRFIVKTIDTTGISIFAHKSAGYVRQTTQKLFGAFNRRVIALCAPLMLLSGMTLMIATTHGVLYTASLLALLYLSQTIFMAYERLLEVERHYRVLIVSGIPYVCIGLVYWYAESWGLGEGTSLHTVLLIIHGLRGISLAMRVVYARQKYRLKIV